MWGCAIHLDNYRGYYMTGDTITGKVVCSFQVAENIQGIRVRLIGSEQTKWKTWEDRQRINNKPGAGTVYYNGENTFLGQEVELIGRVNMDPGIYESPFMFVLPKNLPGTYDGKHGSIKYCLKARVDMKRKFGYDYEKELKIIGLIDFNEIGSQLQLEPITYAATKTFCCWCCSNGAITMNVELEKEAFVQGETVDVKVDITNHSSKNIDAVEVEIKRKIESKATYPKTRYNRNNEKLAFSRETGVAAHSSRIYTFLMEIPRTAVLPNFTASTLFTDSSKIKVKAILPLGYKPLKVSSNIVMGHVPVGEEAENMSFDHIFYLQCPNTEDTPLHALPGPAAAAIPPEDYLSRELPKKFDQVLSISSISLENAPGSSHMDIRARDRALPTYDEAIRPV